jgi:lysophospholipase L1-like esterase
MIKKIFIFILFFGVSSSTFAQKRYKSEIFTSTDSLINIQYGQAVNLKGIDEKLLLDIITPPKSDTLKLRPLLIFIHGGGFKNNSKNGSYSSMVCNSFAKRGYVTATIDYRLGVAKDNTDKDYFEAMYRAQQDGKAAIRFFRRYAEKYGVDTAQIFITGSSAGSKTCMAIGYMDEKDIPKEINKEKWGTLEGNSGNKNYSSKVHAVLNAWGAIPDYSWIEKGDVPLFTTAGTADKTVAFDSSFVYHGFKYGPYALYEKCLSLGIPTGWRPFYNTGHTLDNNKKKQDSCINSMAAWLYTQLKINKGNNIEGVLRYEKDIQAFDSINAVSKYSDKAIMFIGSSYIRLWKNIKEDLKYKEIIQRGFGGSNLRDVAYYIKRIVYPLNPKAIFIYVGNDITAGEKDKAPDQVLEHYKYIVKIIRQKYPTVPITWLAISPSEKRWAQWAEVQEANALIKSFCDNNPNLYFIDAGKMFLGKEGKPIAALYQNDKLHYNAEGYKTWGENIWKQVNEISK